MAIEFSNESEGTFWSTDEIKGAARVLQLSQPSLRCTLKKHDENGRNLIRFFVIVLEDYVY